MGFEKVFDSLTFKRMDALREKFQSSSIMFGATVFGYMQW